MSNDSITSASTIRKLIDYVSQLQRQNTLNGAATGDTIKASQDNSALELYRNALIYAWEQWGYGTHADFQREGDDATAYMMFELDATRQLAELCQTLAAGSPFPRDDEGDQAVEQMLEIFVVVAISTSSQHDS